MGPALNDRGYYVGRVERNLFWVTDGTYQSAFLTTPDGVVLFPPPIMAKYTGVLAAADIEIFVWTTAFAIMESIGLDQGPSSPIHP
jgi:hypothetical protein